jgi:endoglucanase
MGGFIRQAPYAGAPGQQWNLISVGNGWYEITNVASGQSLDVTEGSTAAGALLVQYPYHDVAREQWTFVR